MGNQFYLTKERFLEMQKSFSIEPKEEKNYFSIQSPIENVEIFKSDTGEKTTIKRKLQSGYTVSETEVSDKYFPVFDSLILQGLFTHPYFDSFKQEIKDVRFKLEGGFEINFGTNYTSKEPVLDIIADRGSRSYWLNNVDNFHIDRRDFGNYGKKLIIRNSYDKSRRFQLELGIVRLICTNGMVGMANTVQERKLHLVCNKEKIIDSIQSALDNLPEVLNQEKLYDGLLETKLTETVKSSFYKEAVEYTNERIEKVMQKGESVRGYQVMLQILAVLVPQMKNLLDFQNAIGYFLVQGRFAGFAKTLAERYWNTMKRNLNN